MAARDSDLNRQPETVAVVNAVRRILRALRVAAGQTQASVGISAAQLYVLRQLDEGDALSISELAELTLTDRSSVATVVERLVAEGIVERTPSQRDRRRAEVRITPAGRHMLDLAPPAPTSLLVAGLERLSDTDVHALSQSLARLVTAMGLDEGTAPMLFEDESARES